MSELAEPIHRTYEHDGKKYVVRRNANCVEQWPACVDGDYNPQCCRFPKVCSCDEHEEVS